jgi:hypothetical protein
VAEYGRSHPRVIEKLVFAKLIEKGNNHAGITIIGDFQ